MLALCANDRLLMLELFTADDALVSFFALFASFFVDLVRHVAEQSFDFFLYKTLWTCLLT